MVDWERGGGREVPPLIFSRKENAVSKDVCRDHHSILAPRQLCHLTLGLSFPMGQAESFEHQ